MTRVPQEWLDLLSPEDALACRRDVIEYGSMFVRRLPDGGVVRVPAAEVLVDDAPKPDGPPWWQS